MADESTDVASTKEPSVCARSLLQNKPVEHFLGVLQAKQANAEAIVRYILDFLQARGIAFDKMGALGSDGASIMSGNKLHTPSAFYLHCRCYQLQMAADKNTELVEVVLLSHFF